MWQEKWSCGWKKTTKAALGRQEEAMTDRQKHQDASMKASKGRLRSSSLLGKDSNVWNSGTGTQWQLVQHAGKRCYQYSVCELAHTHAFPNTHGLGNFSLLLPLPEVCHAAMPTKCAESIAWQCFHNKLSWPGAIHTSLAPQTKWTVTAGSLSLCRSTWLTRFEEAISKLLLHHFTLTCLTSASHHTSRQEKPQSLNHRLKSTELHNITKGLLLC